MSDTEQQPTASDLIFSKLKTLVTDVRLLLVAIVGLFLTGVTALAQVQTVARAEAKQTVAGLDASVDALKARLESHEQASQLTHRLLSDEVVELKDETKQTRQQVEGLREDLRRLFPSLPPVARDGGAP